MGSPQERGACEVRTLAGHRCVHPLPVQMARTPVVGQQGEGSPGNHTSSGPLTGGARRSWGCWTAPCQPREPSGAGPEGGREEMPAWGGGSSVNGHPHGVATGPQGERPRVTCGSSCCGEEAGRDSGSRGRGQPRVPRAQAGGSPAGRQTRGPEPQRRGQRRAGAGGWEADVTRMEVTWRRLSGPDTTSGCGRGLGGTRHVETTSVRGRAEPRWRRGAGCRTTDHAPRGCWPSSWTGSFQRSGSQVQSHRQKVLAAHGLPAGAVGPRGRGPRSRCGQADRPPAPAASGDPCSADFQ